MDIENLRALAQEAAKSDFLWELGMRARSATHARNICKDLAVPLAYEKRVKAVMRLRETDLQALREIRDDATDEGDETMVEVFEGLDRLAGTARQRDTALWDKIRLDLGIVSYCQVAENLKKIEIKNACEEARQESRRLAEGLPRAIYCAGRSPRGIFLPNFKSGLKVDPHFEDSYWAKATGRVGEYRLVVCTSDGSCTYPLVSVEPEIDMNVAILVWPTWICQPSEIWMNSQNSASSFYNDARQKPFKVSLGIKDWPATYRWFSDIYWADAVLSVRRRGFMPLARKIAKAYEAETARRRKPAKAVVLKNY